VLAALVVGVCSTVALTVTPVTAAAQVTAEPVAPSTAVVYEKGPMDTSEVPLSGPTVADGPAARSSSSGPAPGATGWTTTIDLLPGTQMVALSWDGIGSGPDAHLSLRSRRAGAWTPWITPAPDPNDQGGEGAGRVGTDVVWLGSEGADAVEVRIDQGPLPSLELLRMRFEEGEPVTDPAPAPEARTASRAAAKPTIRPRSEWASGGWKSGTSGCGSGPTIDPELKHAVVHHTASTNSYTASQVPNLIDAIYQYHTASLGWCDIAYHFVVDKFGTIWQGRSGDIAKPVQGGHAKGFNRGSVGVTLLGQFEPTATPASAQPTSAMMDSAAKLLAWKLSLHGLDPNGSVTLTSAGNSKYPSGRQVTLPVINYHRQSSDTACPGANVIAKMPALRDAVTWYMGGSGPVDPPPPTEPEPPVVDWTPFKSAEDLVWRQYSDFRRDPGTYEDRKWWFTELKAGRTNRNALVAALIRSPWVEDRSLDSVRLYLTYFGRIPDSAGIRYWWSEVDKGRNLRTVSARFSGSPEFKSTYGNLSDEQFVRLVYRNVLGREGTTADIEYWTGQITGKKDSRGGVMALFSKTKEYKDRSRSVVEVILVHEVMLGRAIGAQSHMEWVARVQRDGIGSFIGTLFASQEYAQRFGA
jgi:hypothetical protein